MSEAACRRPEHSGVDFFPGRHPRAHLAALAVCRQCAVLDSCRTWILDVETGPGVGIVGGMTGRQRLELRQQTTADGGAMTVGLRPPGGHHGDANRSARPDLLRWSRSLADKFPKTLPGGEMTYCAKCESPLPERAPGPGRSAIYCGAACRRAAEFELRRLQNHLLDAEKRLTEAQAFVDGRSRWYRFGPEAAVRDRDRWRFEVDRLEARMRELFADPEVKVR